MIRNDNGKQSVESEGLWWVASSPHHERHVMYAKGMNDAAHPCGILKQAFALCGNRLLRDHHAQQEEAHVNKELSGSSTFA